MSKSLFIFTGEFGYEIISFQSILRAHREKFETIYVSSYKESEIFYKDFVDKFIELPEYILEKFDRSDSYNTLPDLELDTFIKPYIEDKFEVYHRKKIYEHYPLDIKLDLTGDFGKYISLNKKINKGERIITIFPRLHNIHEHRNYNTDKFRTFVDLIKSQFIDYKINIVFFENKYYGNNKNSLYISGTNPIVNPSIQDQIDLQAVSEFLIYNHSGSVFLNTMNSEKTPIFIYGIESDKSIYPSESIFNKFGINFEYVYKTNNVSDMEPQYLFQKFKNFYDTFRK